MSNLQSFMAGKHQPRPASPAIPPQVRDRRDAAALKIPTTKRPFNTSTQKLPSTATPLGYASNIYGDRNTFPNQQYVHQPETYAPAQEMYVQELAQQTYVQEHDAFDETIHSDFDKTITDSGFHNGQQGYQENDQDEYEDEEAESEYAEPFNASRPSYPPHPLNHKQSQVHLAPLTEERSMELPTRMQASAINNRFANANNNRLTDQENQHLRKRSRSAERKPVHDEYELPPPENAAEDDLDSQQDPESPTPPSLSRKQVRLNSQFTHSQDTPLPRKGLQWQKKPDDYTDEELKAMDYATLANQPWDPFPDQRKFELAPELRGPNITLGDKISHYVMHENNFQSNQIPTNERDSQTPDFFTKMSIEEWEEAGDWFIAKFGDYLKQMKEKRVQKRKLTAKFEREIQRREKAVRGKSENLARKFEGMRASGEDMLRGKMG